MSDQFTVQFGPKVVSVVEKVGYGFGHFFNDLCANMWFSYFIIFMNKVVGLTPFYSGILLLVGQIADALATVLIGFEADRMYPTWYGKRMIWHLFGTIGVAISFPFIFIPCPFIPLDSGLGGSWALVVYYVPFVVIFQIGWAAVQTSHLSLIVDMSPSPDIRTQLNSLRTSMSIIAGLSVYISFWIGLGKSSNDAHLGAKDYALFQWVTIAVTGLGTFTSVLHHVLLREPITPMPATTQLDTESEKNVKIDYKYWLRSETFYRITSLYVVTRMVANISQVYFMVYLVESTPYSKNILGLAPLIIYIFGFLMSVAMTYVLKLISADVVMISGGLGVAIMSTWLYVLGSANLPILSSEIQTLICCAILGIITNAFLISSFRKVTDMIGVHKESNSFIMGFMSFADKLANGVAVVVIQYFTPVSKGIDINGPRSTFLRYIVSLVPTGLSMLLILIICVSICFPYKSLNNSIEATRDATDINESDL